MFSVTVEERQFPTYILQDAAANSSVEVVPQRGGIVTLWEYQGQPVFYLDRDRFQDPQLSVRGGNPILFPICGNVPNDTYTLDGQPYQLAQHGFARNLPWAVLGHHTDGAASLTITLTPTPTTLEVYPFQFELIFTYKLQGNTFTVEQSIRNQSDRPMPFSIGFHPYFEVGNKQQLTVELPSKFYQQKDGGTAYPFDGTIDYHQPEIDIAFPQLHGNTATIIDRDRGRKTTLTYDQDFSTLVFWTLQGKNFVCVEPWSGPRNAINTGNQLTILEPQGSLDTSIAISVANL